MRSEVYEYFKGEEDVELVEDFDDLSERKGMLLLQERWANGVKRMLLTVCDTSWGHVQQMLNSTRWTPTVVDNLEPGKVCAVVVRKDF